MKIMSFLVIAFLHLVACLPAEQPVESPGIHDPLSKAGAAKVESANVFCFDRYSGLKNQDTSAVTLVIKANSVSGLYSDYPYQKDARVGTITGTKNGDTIKGVWRYQQEGIEDSIRFEFILQGRRMLQRNTSLDMHSGREFLSDTAAFSRIYMQVSCENRQREF
jgi:hypothetical protein